VQRADSPSFSNSIAERVASSILPSPHHEDDFQLGPPANTVSPLFHVSSPPRAPAQMMDTARPPPSSDPMAIAGGGRLEEASPRQARSFEDLLLVAGIKPLRGQGGPERPFRPTGEMVNIADVRPSTLLV
jgi:hypothetical protein